MTNCGEATHRSLAAYAEHLVEELAGKPLDRALLRVFAETVDGADRRCRGADPAISPTSSRDMAPMSKASIYRRR